MELKFYNLMYVDLEEKRYLSGKTYNNEERIDLYVKGSCVLDKSLRINSLGGVNIITNNKTLISNSLHRIGYNNINIIEIPFSLNVPKGIPFFSAHFKIEVYKYFASCSHDEYSILLDSDVVCLNSLNEEFYSITNNRIPMIYYLNSYGGEKKLHDVRLIDKDIEWLPWAGGEFIGGDAAFFNALYREILLFKDNYWNVVHNGLFHVGDEMLTSIALARLRKYGICPVDAKWFGVIYRYWSIAESKGIFEYKTSFIHLPGDKTFEYGLNLQSNSVKKMFKAYWLYHFLKRVKSYVKRIISQ